MERQGEPERGTGGPPDPDGMNQGYQSIIERDERRGHPVVIKRARRSSVPLWRWVEAWILGREARALHQLQDVPEVPVLIERPDPWTLVMEHREGVPLSEMDPASLPSEYFQQLEDVIDALHERGVVHSDLKKKDNLMVTPEGDPVVLDFGASFRQGSGWRLVNRFLYRQFKQIDRNAISKLKQRYCEELVTDRDRENLENPVLLERVSRIGRKLLPWR